jgi:indolepyruvate decarboxylase
MVNAVAAAYAEKSPLVVISGGPGKDEAGSGLLLHHQAKSLDSQFEIYKEITCNQVRLNDAARAPADIARALASCLRQSRPVYVELPRDMVAVACKPVVPLPAPAVDREAVKACVDEILARLAAARSPVLMVCIEVRRFNLEDKVAELARRLAIPVVTSFMGRGLLAGRDAPPDVPLAGTYMGVAGLPEVTSLVEESDGLFLLGTILSDTNFAISKKKIDLRKTIHAFDGRVTLGYHVYPDIPLPVLVDGLLERLSSATVRPVARRREYPRGMPADGRQVEPDDVALLVNDLFTAQGPMLIASDIGDCLFTAMQIDAALVAPGYYATMGFGVPAGLGLQAATGQRPLVMVGDGAFQMTGWELGNCRRYGWDPIVLLFNNGGWEMLRTFQPGSRFNDLDEWGFAKTAEGLGGDGVRVRTRAELKAALDRAVATRGRFQLIEIMIPRGVLSSTLARYVEGVKRMSGMA